MTNQPPAKPPRVSYLWFSGKDGWQVTSFDPRTDHAIGFKGDDVHLYVSKPYADRLEQEIAFVKTQWKQTSALLLQERNRLAAELADVRAAHAEFCEQAQEKTDKDFAIVREAAERAREDRDQALAQAAALAGALKKCIYDSERLEHGQWAVDQANEALAALEALRPRIQELESALEACADWLLETEDEMNHQPGWQNASRKIGQALGRGEGES